MDSISQIGLQVPISWMITKLKSVYRVQSLLPQSSIKKLFLSIREHHPDDVFSSMEKIIMLVLEKSDDISQHLLFVLLNSIKKDNEEGSAGRKLGERVLEKCIAKKIANKIRPKLVQTVKTLGVSVDEYSSVLASVFQDKKLLVSLGEDGECVTGELVEDKGDSEKQSPEEATQVVKEEAGEAVHSQQDNALADTKSISNGVTSIREDNALADTKSIKKQEDADCSDHSKGLVKSGYEELNDLNAEPSKSAKPSERQIVAIEKEAGKVLDSESHSKEALSSPHGEDSVGTAGALESDEEIHAKISSPKTCNAEPEIVASPSPTSESLPDKSHSKQSKNWWNFV